jgi:hypothetical protein
MNGTAVIGAASLGNPGPDWHIMGTGYYNHDDDPISYGRTAAAK